MTRKIGIVIAGALAVFSLAAGLSLYGSHPVRSSDHQDSPLTVARPGADLSDLYAFPAPDNDNDVVLVMNVHPIIPAGMGRQTRFDPGVMYQFKIDNTGDHVEDLVIQFKADAAGSSQKIAMFGPAKPQAAGTRSAWVSETGSVTYDKVATLGNGVKLYAGPRKDPFFFDLAQFFKIVPDRNAGYHAAGQSVPAATATAFNNPGTDFLSTNRFNVLSIVAELPRTMLSPSYGPPGKINLWATTSTADGGGYQQVERLARPAVKEAFEAFADHDRTNRSTPTDDRVLSDSIDKFMTTVAGRSPQIANIVRSVLIPDELSIDLSQTSVQAAYLGVETGGVTGSKFGGRGLRDDVIDLSLGVVFGNTVPALKLAPDDGKESPGLTSDHVGPNQSYGKTFPYLNEPY
ncbi:MAG: DUF4331 domain-containing protein [Candidatus Eremiobacter antarcticus]|nr:DUF4331 family protein [Candidatus Eremiobacteraeota bacterium]MBC5807533.1 DUF4331 family protein [Candidatus Eremiobacteraeota bacterium]PZR61415.1 MAG: DUF4331 domain-containing protein [Candidatus Eremiobacter sp. RRmetagenome_bin22]